MLIRDLDHRADAPVCDMIVRGLPEWLGAEQGRVDCAAAVRSQCGLVAEGEDGLFGFVTWEVRDEVAEITWMAVRAHNRRRGVGRVLVRALVDRLRAVGVREVRVKTLSSHDPYPPYAETRAFYQSNGFEEIEELDIWGPENPAVLLARVLGR